MGQYIFLESLYTRRRANIKEETRRKQPMSKCFKCFDRIIIGGWEGSRKRHATERERRYFPQSDPQRSAKSAEI